MNQEPFVEKIHRKIEDIQAQLTQVQQLLDSLGPVDEQRASKEKALEFGSVESDNRDTIIEGVFDGQNMVGPDGRVYTVPANYASKSKLVEGDIMKLTIKQDGSFIYKQIGPVKRNREVGTLVRDAETGAYRVVTQRGKSYRLITASVTYYKGEPNDGVIMLIPADMPARWAAVENVIKQTDDVDDMDAHMQLLLNDGMNAELPMGDDLELGGGSNAELI
ncbi:MAG: hypothetical protein HYV32_05980 [Candidatus Kerfeldbacteria bacterium]|nr:hypothetical protein [Candidatus Kerfeldbacteria bacterium]